MIFSNKPHFASLIFIPFFALPEPSPRTRGRHRKAPRPLTASSFSKRQFPPLSDAVGPSSNTSFSQAGGHAPGRQPQAGGR